jgi:uncharacterized membrane protein
MSDGQRGTGGTERRSGSAESAVGLGLLGLGLGLAELLAPRAIARLVGAGSGRVATGVVRGLGARELVVGAGLLAGRRSRGWLWARVAGDAIDLALLGAALRARPESRGRLVGALAVAGGVTALDAAAAVSATRDDRTRVVPPVRRSITVARPRDEVYRFWRRLENAPAFMADVESVEVLDAGRSRWSARGPVGPVVSWEAELLADVPGERLAWRSIEGSPVRTEGEVRFEAAPGGRGTEVRLDLRYGPADGAGGRAAAFLWKAAAAHQIEADLRRCKQLIETGHVVHSDASQHGGPHPARPAAEPAEGAAS